MQSFEPLEQLIEDIEILPDPQERLAALVQWGRKAEELPIAEQTEAKSIKGCQSRVWLDCHHNGSLCEFRVAADSAMVRGLVGVTVRLAHGQNSEQLATADLDWAKRLKLDRMITPTRLNGLAAVASAVRVLARTNPTH